MSMPEMSIHGPVTKTVWWYRIQELLDDLNRATADLQSKISNGAYPTDLQQAADSVRDLRSQFTGAARILGVTPERLRTLLDQRKAHITRHENDENVTFA